jgi:hypothetical protein
VKLDSYRRLQVARDSCVRGFRASAPEQVLEFSVGFGETV